MLAFSLFGHVPWPVFATVWSVLIALAIAFMAGPFTLPLMLTNPIASEVTLGNIHAFTGLVVIAGFKKPALWAFVLLTKVTPGVGLLWFVFRREWRSLGIALGATAVLVVPTLILAPELWVRWVQALVNASHAKEYASGIFTVPLWVRLPAAVAILWVGARRDWAWVVPIAATLGLPVLWTTASPSPWRRSGWRCIPTGCRIGRGRPLRPPPRSRPPGRRFLPTSGGRAEARRQHRRPRDCHGAARPPGRGARRGARTS